MQMHKVSRDKDSFVGESGGVICRWTELNSPTLVAMTWTWVRGPYPGTPVLPTDARLTMRLDDLSTQADSPLTHLVLTHSDVPAEWVDDMTAVWTSKVDQWAYQSRPKRRRR